MSASDIRQELADYYNYLKFACALNEKSDARHERLRDLLKEVAVFIETATSKRLKDQGKQLLQLLKQAVEANAKLLPRRQPPRQIARDFLELNAQTDVWRLGVPYGWLQERFEPRGLMLDPNLPPHAKVGIGVHAGRASVEEIFLLEDTYFLLARAESAFDRMHTDAKFLNKSPGAWNSGSGYEKLSILNAEVGTFSRLSVVSAAAFVEAFVNSVGWAESERGSHRSEDVRIQLKGTRKERYLSLEAKLERFPKLIRADGVTPIVLSDPRQAKEPFTSFLAETKELRDASMHYAPGKAMIWRPPEEWLKSGQRAAEYAVRVAESFWIACYPERESPQYLSNLNHAKLIEVARERVKRVDYAVDATAS